MTTKGAYESILIELRKAKAPSLHLEDYNYWINKGIQEYINERYNKFETSQQITDDMQPLMVYDNFIVTGLGTGFYESNPAAIIPIYRGKKYNSDFLRFNAPQNYWHGTGGNVTLYAKFPYKCYPIGYEYSKPSKKLSASNSDGIMDNAYLKPNFTRPYHDFSDGAGNSLSPALSFYFGDVKKYDIKSVYVDYLKKPQPINLTIAQRDAYTDTSAPLEFPDYTCNEIVKRCVRLLLENSSDPRLQSFIPVQTTIP
jgi:hypothetical protein